jgi:hypothetical protein
MKGVPEHAHVSIIAFSGWLYTELTLNSNWLVLFNLAGKVTFVTIDKNKRAIHHDTRRRQERSTVKVAARV